MTKEEILNKACEDCPLCTNLCDKYEEFRHNCIYRQIEENCHNIIYDFNHKDWKDINDKPSYPYIVVFQSKDGYWGIYNFACLPTSWERFVKLYKVTKWFNPEDYEE